MRRSLGIFLALLCGASGAKAAQFGSATAAVVVTVASFFVGEGEEQPAARGVARVGEKVSVATRAEPLIAGSGEAAVTSNAIKAADTAERECADVLEVGAAKGKREASLTAEEDTCFVAGTLVATAYGLQSIQTIQTNELVWSFNGQTGQWEIKAVEATFEHDYVGDLMTISIGETRIEATGNHPFWVVAGADLENRPQAKDATNNLSRLDGRWVEARDLQTSDQLLSEQGEQVAITQIARQMVHEAVYNIRVADDHDYAVSVQRVLVHNKAFQRSPVPMEGGGWMMPDGTIVSGKMAPGGMPVNPTAYSVAFQTKLAPSELFLNEYRQFEVANQALRAEREVNPVLADLVPAPTRWGKAPDGWTWQHATMDQAGNQIGVLQLVPRYQHSADSPWWSLLHPYPGGGGGYWEWALPAGAPAR